MCGLRCVVASWMMVGLLHCAGLIGERALTGVLGGLPLSTVVVDGSWSIGFASGGGS